MERNPTKEWKDFIRRVILVCCLIIFIVFGYAAYMVYSFMREDAAHRKQHPDAATINNKLAPEYAKLISDALNKYFADHKEYPWQIYGGKPGWRTEDPKKDMDPLIAQGYLAEGYPRHYYSNSISSGIAIANLVSAPHDALMEEKVFRNPPGPQKPTSDQFENAKNFERSLARYESDMAKHKEWLSRYKKFRATVSVIYAAGGRKPSPAWLEKHPGNPGPEPCIALPGLKKEMEFLGIYWPDDLPAMALSCNFGYVRGERMGADKKTAFLWIYGSPSSAINDIGKEILNGLDVLNAETGELKPDGIPDGVAVLCELRSGQVVNITKAESM